MDSCPFSYLEGTSHYNEPLKIFVTRLVALFLLFDRRLACHHLARARKKNRKIEGKKKEQTLAEESSSGLRQHTASREEKKEENSNK